MTHAVYIEILLEDLAETIDLMTVAGSDVVRVPVAGEIRPNKELVHQRFSVLRTKIFYNPHE